MSVQEVVDWYAKERSWSVEEANDNRALAEEARGHMAHLPREPISGVGTRVYVITDARGYVKVGVSRHPEGRAHALAAGNPTKLKVVYETKPFSRAYALALEAAAHDFLAGCNLGREWFACEFRAAVEALHLLGGLGDEA